MWLTFAIKYSNLYRIAPDITHIVQHQDLEQYYRKVSNMRRTKYQNLNDSRLILQLYVPKPLKPSVKSIMQMWLEQRRQAMPQLHLNYRQFYCQLRCVLYQRLDGMFQKQLSSNITINLAKLRDFIAATVLVILVKLDSFFNFCGPYDPEIRWTNSKKTLGRLLCAMSSHVHYFKAISKFKLELQSGCAQLRVKVVYSLWPWYLADDLQKWQGSFSVLLRVLCIISWPSVNSNRSYSPETLNSVEDRRFLYHVTLKFGGWPWKTIEHLLYTTSGFVHHFSAVSQFKLVAQPWNAQFWSKLAIFGPVWPRNLMGDLEKTKRAPFLCYFKLWASFHNRQFIKTRVTFRKRPICVKIGNFLSRVTLQFDVRSRKTTRHLFFATSSYVHHFVAICKFKTGNTGPNVFFEFVHLISGSYGPQKLKNESSLTKITGTVAAIKSLSFARKHPNLDKICFDLCDLDLWHLTSDLLHVHFCQW